MISFVAGSVYYSYTQVPPAIIGLVVDTIGEDRTSYWLDRHAGDRLVRLTPELGASLDAVKEMSDAEFLAEYNTKAVAKPTAEALEKDFVERLKNGGLGKYQHSIDQHHLSYTPPDTYEDEVIVSEKEAELIGSGDLLLPWVGQGSARKNDYSMLLKCKKYPEFKMERIYSVPVLKARPRELQDSLALLLKFSQPGLEHRVSREPFAGIMVDEEGNEIVRLSLPIRLTVRDWTARKRFKLAGKVKVGPGKGKPIKRRVGAGTEQDMPYNTRVEFKASPDGKFRSNSAVTYRRLDVANLFNVHKGHIPMLKTDGLIHETGRCKDMVDVILDHLKACGLNPFSGDWVSRGLEESQTHPGYYQGWIEANPDSLAFVGAVPVLVQVF